MKKLYIIDDDQDFLDIVSYILGKNYKVVTTNALKLDEVASYKPDLILMDLNLPDIDGLEATSRLKAQPELAHIPVVALTANAMHGDRERCLAAGCDGYIPKPITKSELLNTVAMLLSGSSKNGAKRA